MMSFSYTTSATRGAALSRAHSLRMAVILLALAALLSGCRRGDVAAEVAETATASDTIATNTVAATASAARRDLMTVTQRLRQEDAECQRLGAEIIAWRNTVITNELAIQERLAADPEWARLRAELGAAQRVSDQRQRQVAARRLAQVRQGVTQEVVAAAEGATVMDAASLVELNRTFYKATQRVREEDEACRALVATNKVLRQAMADNDTAIRQRLAADPEWARLDNESRAADRKYRQQRRDEGHFLRTPTTPLNKPPQQ